MRDFNNSRGNSSRYSGRGGASSSSRYNDRGSSSRYNDRGSSERHEMFPAVCDECGKDCEVPFRPTGEKPVYCSKCFETKEGGSSRGRDSYGGGRERNDRGGRGDREMYSVVCDSCGKPDRVPFKPTPGKPIYCSECFEQKGNNSNSVQLEEIKEKLDRILAKLEA